MQVDTPLVDVKIPAAPAPPPAATRMQFDVAKQLAVPVSTPTIGAAPYEVDRQLLENWNTIYPVVHWFFKHGQIDPDETDDPYKFWKLMQEFYDFVNEIPPVSYPLAQFTAPTLLWNRQIPKTLTTQPLPQPNLVSGWGVGFSGAPQGNVAVLCQFPAGARMIETNKEYIVVGGSFRFVGKETRYVSIGGVSQITVISVVYEPGTQQLVWPGDSKDPVVRANYNRLVATQILPNMVAAIRPYATGVENEAHFEVLKKRVGYTGKETLLDPVFRPFYLTALLREAKSKVDRITGAYDADTISGPLAELIIRQYCKKKTGGRSDRMPAGFRPSLR